MKHSIILKDGSEWACDTGTSQTPYFKTPAQLSAYVHKNYFTADFDKLPRMVGNDW